MTKRPWIFLALWTVANVTMATVLFKWSTKNPEVTNWMKGPQALFVTSLSGLLIGVMIIIAIHRPKFPEGLPELFSLRPNFKETKLVWLFVGILIAILVKTLSRTWHAGSPHIATAISRARVEGGLAYVVAAAVLGPIPEEMILRGYLYQAFSSSYGKAVGTVILIILSLLLHASGAFRSVYGICVYGGLAAFICWIFDSKRNLFDCIAFHMAYNATIMCLDILAH
jgi:membrane protease YdiL (CAAX protease family)